MFNLALREKIKRAALKSSASLISHVPKTGLKFLVKQVKRKMEKYYDKNPDGYSPRKLRYFRGWTMKMCDAFLYHYDRFSPQVRYKMVRNLGQNALLEAKTRRKEFEKEMGFKPPALTVMSPTMQCNLSCTGCYAFEYNKTKNGDISYELMNKVANEAEDMGQAFMVITGGEPYVRKDDILRLAKEHNEMFFITYTNGHLIDKELAHEISKLGNIAPCISVEGYEKETDKRRGEGAHSKVLRAMKYLREEGAPFAISVTVTRNNAELVTSDEFFDFYIKQGVVFAWFFQYMPIGRSPDLNLMVTPEQRNLCRRKIRELRESSKPILAADFWGDALLSGGCLAAGRAYIHVSGTGWIEPCVFTHFAVHNIKDSTIKEALSSKFMRSYHDKQTDVKNRFLPCGIIDYPENLRDAVKGARKLGENVRETHPGAESIISDLAPRIDKMAAERHKVIDKDWESGKL